MRDPHDIGWRMLSITIRRYDARAIGMVRKQMTKARLQGTAFAGILGVMQHRHPVRLRDRAKGLLSLNAAPIVNNDDLVAFISNKFSR